jgi:hypothetical protein
MSLDNELKKIDDIVKHFVQSINEEYDCAMGLDFMAQLDNDIVVWSILTLEKSGEAFYNNFVSRFPKAKGFSLFTLSVLHEVGHLETENEMEDDVDIRNNEIMTNEEYFNLFNERIATDWAGYWIEKNFQKAISLDATFRIALNNLYAETLD